MRVHDASDVKMSAAFAGGFQSRHKMTMRVIHSSEESRRNAPTRDTATSSTESCHPKVRSARGKKTKGHVGS